MALTEEPLGAQLDSARAVSMLAHTCGVAVEGAVREGTDIDQTRDYSTETDIGALRVLAAGDQPIDSRWLRAVADTSGLPLALADAARCSAEQCRALIDSGVACFKYDGVIGSAIARVAESARAGERADAGCATLARETRETVARHMEPLGSDGQGEAALRACRPWREVEHLIIYNVDEQLSEDDVNAMMERGRAELTMIPGVRRVFTGRATDTGAQYRYCWLVRFCDRAVIPHYRDHPDHVEFANTVFRPVAGNRISIDFEAVD